MKKAAIVVALLLVLLTFVGCEKKYTPDPEVEQYLNTGLTPDKAYSRIVSVSYTTQNTVKDKNGTVTGENKVQVEFDISDAENLIYTNKQTYMGIYVQDGTVESVSTAVKTADGYSFETVRTAQDGTVSKSAQSVDVEFVTDLIRSHVFKQNGVYAEGGLYFGDYFMQYIYRYPPEAFYVDKQENLCVFDAVVHVSNDALDNTYITQKIKINTLGLITYYYEQYQDVNTGTTLTSETLPAYVLTEEGEQPANA